ncbi:MAG: hypothetical protein PUB86_01320 [Elusimicrobia bacterium]|nr:hypothetical protein [Elusimicrobiota bacterium]
MSKIKFFILPLFVLLFACAPKLNLIKGDEPVRNYPVFLTGWESSAVFKAEFKTGNYKNNFLLIINKRKYADFQIKITGDYASVLLNADFKGGSFSYNYVLKSLFNKTARGVFEDMVKILLVKPSGYQGYSYEDEIGLIVFKEGKFINSYFFKRGLSYPYAMKQSQGKINKNVEFNDYQVFGERPLPHQIIFTEEKGRAEIVLTLLSLK